MKDFEANEPLAFYDMEPQSTVAFPTDLVNRMLTVAVTDYGINSDRGLLDARLKAVAQMRRHQPFKRYDIDQWSLFEMKLRAEGWTIFHTGSWHDTRHVLTTNHKDFGVLVIKCDGTMFTPPNYDGAREPSRAFIFAEPRAMDYISELMSLVASPEPTLDELATVLPGKHWSPENYLDVNTIISRTEDLIEPQVLTVAKELGFAVTELRDRRYKIDNFYLVFDADVYRLLTTEMSCAAMWGHFSKIRDKIYLKGTVSE